MSLLCYRQHRHVQKDDIGSQADATLQVVFPQAMGFVICRQTINKSTLCIEFVTTRKVFPITCPVDRKRFNSISLHRQIVQYGFQNFYSA